MKTEESILFITLATAGFVVARIPKIGKVVRGITTLYHELGHALAALLTSGEVLKMELLSDTSGTTITKSKGKTAQIIIALSGYTFASIITLIYIFAISKGYENIVHIAFLASFVICLLFFVRNIYGILWLIIVGGIYALVLFFEPSFSWMLLYAFCGIMLWEAVFSSFELLKICISKSVDKGDASNLANFTGIHPILWSIFFVLQSMIFAGLSIDLLFKN